MKGKLLKVGVMVMVLAVGAGGIWLWIRPQGEGSARTTLYGNVEIRDARLAFNEQEIVSEVLVEEGDAVSTGQVLARLRSQRLEDQLAEAKAQWQAQAQVVRRLENGTRVQEIEQARALVEAAKARVENAQHKLRRIEETAQSGASSRQALDDAKAALQVEQAQLNVRQEALELALEGPRSEDIEEAKARLEANRSQVAFLEERLKDAILKAPSAGIIRSRILEPGEMAAPDRPAFVLALTDRKWVRAYVPEPDLGRIRAGMPAQVYSDTWPDRAFDGHVGFISPIAEFTPKSVETTDLRTKLVYEVRVWVEDPNDELRLGMPVTVAVEGNGRSP